MKKLLTATLVLSFVLVTGTAFAKGPMNKATGTIWMSNPDQMTSFVAFDAGVSSPDDHGNAEYSNFTYPADTPEGYLHYTASVLCATVSDMDARYISMDSPLGKALMKKTRDDEFSVELPGGKRTFVILEISYPEP